MALLSTGLVACNQDFDTVFSPQTNPQESLLQQSDVSATASSAAAISIADFINEETGLSTAIPIGTVSVKEGAMPANTILKAVVEFSKTADFQSSILLDANSLDGSNEITVQPNQLQDSYYNDITRNPATTDLYIRTVIYTVTGGTAEAIVGKPNENFYCERKVSFTPLNKVQISPAYYIVGGPNDWAASAAEKPIKFNHSDADVYEDPIFSVVFDAAAEGDTWFAIGDDAACEAIGNGDWTKLLGIVGGESQSTEGRLDFRYNMGADNSFCVPAGAKKIKVTLNMLDYTFKVEPVSIADAYYLIGGPGEWSAESAMTMVFTHSSADVFEDPVFTYVFEGNGGDMWFAFGDKDAIDGVAGGDWTKLYGTNGDSKDLSGTFDRRYNLGGDNSFCVDGTAKFYRFQINMAEMTYSITALNFAEYIWQAGNGNGWGSPAAPLYGPAGDGQYTGYMYLDGEFKFRSGEDNWDAPDWGIGAGGEGTLAEQAGNLSAAAGYYMVKVDLGALTYALTPITTIGIVGPAQAGGWSDDTDMTYNAETGAWEATIELAADELKFRANDGWDINWGGTPEALTQGGPNLKIAEAGTYFVQLFAYCDSKAYCTLTKK